MEFLIVILAFFFAILMCLGLILVKWIFAQLGATIFFMLLFLAVAVLVVALAERDYDE